MVTVAKQVASTGRVVLFTAILIWAIGCSNTALTTTPIETVATSVAVFTPQPSETPAPTETISVTATPVRAATPALESTQTPAPTRKPTSTPIPTIAPTGTPPVSDIVWQMPSVDDYRADVDYQLVTPSAESLLQIYYGLHHTIDPFDHDDGIIKPYQSKNDFQKLLIQEISHHETFSYANGALSLYEQLLSEDSSFDTSRQVEAAVALATLNLADGNVMRSFEYRGFKFRPFSADFNFDGEVDHLFQIEAPHPIRPIAVTFDNDLNIFKELPSQINFYTFENVRFDRDFTGDGRPELELVTSVGVSPSESLSILTWDGEALVPLSFSEGYFDAELDFSDIIDYEIIDANEDNVFEVHVTLQAGGVALNWAFCGRKTFQHKWSGMLVSETEISADFDRDQEPSCLATDVLFQEPQPLPDRATVEHIVRILTPSDWAPQEDELSFAHWYALVHIKLAALQYIDGDLEAATDTMNAIWQYRESVRYIDHLHTFWQESSADFMVFCRSIYQNYPAYDSLSDDHAYNSLSGDFNDRIYHLGGRYNNTLKAIPFGAYYCPSIQVTQSTIDRLPLTQDMPTSIFTDAGIPVSYVTEVNLDDDTELELVAIVDAGKPQIGSWDFEGGQWEYKHLAELKEDTNQLSIISSSTDAAQFILRDVTGDENNDLLLWRVLRGRYPYSSQEGEQLIDALAVYDLTNEELIINSTAEVASIDDVDQLLVTKMIAELPSEWANFSPALFKVTVAGEERPVYQTLSGFTTQAVTGENPATLRSGIQEAQSQLQLEEVHADLVDIQLQYLMAHSYELEGNSAEAINHYRNLIESAPNSMWSWLAFAKLQPVEQ